MVALRTIDLRNDIKKVGDLVMSGERVLISRPRNENLVILSEKEYNEMEKAMRNAAYMVMLDKSESQIAEGKTISFLMEDLEKMEDMTPQEAQIFVAKIRMKQKK